MIGVLVGTGEAPLAGAADGAAGGFAPEGGGTLGRTGALAALAAMLTPPLGRGAADCAGAGAGGFPAARGATSGRDEAPLEPAPGIMGRGGNKTGRAALWPAVAADGAAMDGGAVCRGGP